MQQVSPYPEDAGPNSPWGWICTTSYFDLLQRDLRKMTAEFLISAVKRERDILETKRNGASCALYKKRQEWANLSYYFKEMTEEDLREEERLKHNVALAKARLADLARSIALGYRTEEVSVAREMPLYDIAAYANVACKTDVPIQEHIIHTIRPL
jgi:DNA-binding protein H-NS